MARVRLKIDIAGTVGDQAWQEIEHFDPIQGAWFGEKYGTSGECTHAESTPHARGEWRGATIQLQTKLLAQYAMSYYLGQKRVVDADIE